MGAGSRLSVVQASSSETRAPVDFRLFAGKAAARLPAMAEARGRVLELARAEGSQGALVQVLESDPVLALAALRAANRGTARGSAGSVPEAVEALGPHRVASVAADVPAFDPFGIGSHADHRRTGFRAHALSVRSLAERIADATGYERVDELVAAALLHDVGKLALAGARPAYAELVPAVATPERRVAAEMRAIGMDHAEAGGRLARLWGLPDGLCAAIARHHDPPADGAALLIGLADMLSHYGADRPIDLERLGAASRAARLDRAVLAEVLYELPLPARSRRRPTTRSPLSERELEVLRRLAGGRVPKQIAADLGLSPSTIRNHLHRIYRRLGAADRTQAVLIAREHGWL